MDSKTSNMPGALPSTPHEEKKRSSIPSILDMESEGSSMYSALDGENEVSSMYSKEYMSSRLIGDNNRRYSVADVEVPSSTLGISDYEDLTRSLTADRAHPPGAFSDFEYLSPSLMEGNARSESVSPAPYIAPPRRSSARDRLVTSDDTSDQEKNYFGFMSDRSKIASSARANRSSVSSSRSGHVSPAPYAARPANVHQTESLVAPDDSIQSEPVSPAPYVAPPADVDQTESLVVSDQFINQERRTSDQSINQERRHSRSLSDESHDMKAPPSPRMNRNNRGSLVSSLRARFELPAVDESAETAKKEDDTIAKARRATPYYPAGTDLIRGDSADGSSITESSKSSKDNTGADVGGSLVSQKMMDKVGLGVAAAELSRQDSGHGSANGSSTAESSKSSKASTKVDMGGTLVSQKMIDKLALFDLSRETSMGSEENEKRGIAITALGEKRWVVPEKRKKKKKVNRNLAYPWWSYKRYSTRFLILLVAGVCCFLALVLGLSIGLWERWVANRPQETSTWKPSPGMTWQIQLSTVVTDPTYLYAAYDVDLFDTPASTITEMHNLGRRVICYFSAGSLENWRPDYNDFPQDAVGNDLAGWAGERYLDYSNKEVRKLMVDRIKKAKEKGCDGVDPDNVDIFQLNTTTLGFSLTQADAVDYLNYLSDHAHKMKVAIGLKNAPTIAEKVISKMDWAIVESCALYDECDYFQPYIEAGRPVLHIEYPDNSVKPINGTYGLQQFLFDSCQASGTHLFSTLIKKTSLDEWALSCPYGLPAYGLY